MSSQNTRPQRTRIGAYGVITRDGSILLCRLTSSIEIYGGWWTLPGGGIDFGEHPEAGMIREVEEETGYIVKSTDILGVNSLTKSSAEDDFHSVQLIYEAEIIGGDMRFEEDGTTDMCEWVPLADLGSTDTVPLVVKAVSLIEVR